jgi:hypothetical protein
MDERAAPDEHYESRRTAGDNVDHQLDRPPALGLVLDA